MQNDELIKLLENNGTILKGHFLLTSGRHSDTYVEKIKLLQYPNAVEKIAQLMKQKLPEDLLNKTDIVIGPAMGGIIFAYELAKQLNKKNMFAQRNAEGKLHFRSGFEIEKNKNVILVEDIVTTGKSIKELISLVNEAEMNIQAVTAIVYRSGNDLNLGVPFYPLLEMNIESFPPDNVPEWLQKIPITKPGRSGKK